MLVHIIADDGQSKLTHVEVVQRIKSLLPDAEPVLTPVPPITTPAADFCAATFGPEPDPGRDGHRP